MGMSGSWRQCLFTDNTMATGASAYTALLGAGLAAGGAYLEGRSNKKIKARIEEIANTPGLDIESISSQALANQGRLLPEAGKLVRTEALDRQSLINELVEQSMPGSRAIRDRITGSAASLAAGQIPQDIQDLLQRQTAARTLGGVGRGGVAPGSFGGNALLRNLGLTSLQGLGMSQDLLQRNRALFPLASPQSAFQFTGPDVGQFLNIRGNERTQRMALLGQAAGIPGMTGAFAGYLSDLGGALMGTGAAGGSAFGGGGEGAPVNNQPRGPSWIDSTYF